MPHKRAKRTTREQVRDQRGTDWAPGKDSLTNEPIPKSASRILNASKIRDDFRLKKRKLDDGEDGERQGKRKKSDGAAAKSGATQKVKGDAKGTRLKIKPGESIQHFNRRVEDDLRPLIKSAMHTSNAVARGVARKEMEGKAQAKDAKAKPTPLPAKRSPSPLRQAEKHEGRPKEFQSLSTSVPRRLNDVAQAPPELKKLPRGAAAAGGGAMGKRVDGVLSMAQKAMMEQERMKAISRYRELKASRRQAGEGGDERARGADDDE